jgi:hypothetical protein
VIFLEGKQVKGLTFIFVVVSIISLFFVVAGFFPLRSLGEHLSFSEDVTVIGFLGGILPLLVSAGVSIFSKFGKKIL